MVSLVKMRKSLTVVCPKCGSTGLLTYRKRIGFYVNHGEKTSHRVSISETVEVPPGQNPISFTFGFSRVVSGMFPPHKCFIDPLGTGFFLLLAKTPSRSEIYNDTSGCIFALFKTLVENPREFFTRLEYLINSRELRYTVIQKYMSSQDEVLKAIAVMYLLTYPFTSFVENPSVLYREITMWLRRIHRRLRSVVVESLSFKECVKKYSSPVSFFYVDMDNPFRELGVEINHSLDEVVSTLLSSNSLFLVKTRKTLEKPSWKNTYVRSIAINVDGGKTNFFFISNYRL